MPHHGFVSSRLATDVFLTTLALCAALVGLFLLVGIIKRKKSFVLRATTALALFVAMLATLWLGSAAFALVVVVLFALALLELSRNFEINRPLYWVSSSVVFVSLLLVGRYLVVAMPFFCVLAVLAFAGSKKVVSRAEFAYSFAALFLSLCAACLIHLAYLDPATIVVLVVLIQLNDAFGLLFGKFFGKHHPFKTISPNKSIEGYAFGAVGVLLGIWLFHVFIPVFDTVRYSEVAVLFAIVFIFANSGDLLFSAVKRKLGIKDFGNVLPGHGGVLDRFDSIFFVAPILYLLIAFDLLSVGG